MKELLNTGVNLPLDYDAATDALIGQVKGYSVAVKENLATASYGCLFWIREGDYTAITTAEEYLREKQKAAPDFIKKFMVSETGVAVALNRLNDDFANVNNLKRFIFDFVSSLSVNYYKNCCCECGTVANLALYTAEGTIAQACSACGAKYQFLRAVECEVQAAAPAEPEAIVEEKEEIPAQETETPVAEEIPALTEIHKEENYIENLLTPVEEPKAEQQNESFESLLTPVEEPKAEQQNESFESLLTLVEEPKAEQQNESFESLLTPVEEPKAEQQNESFESLLTPVEEPKAEQQNEEIDNLLFSAEESAAEEKEESSDKVDLQKNETADDFSEFMFNESEQEPAAEISEKEVTKQQPAANFDSLLIGEDEVEKSEPVKSALFEQIEREYAAEQAKLEAEAPQQQNEENLNDLLLDDKGEFTLKEIEPEVDDGSSDVTEFHDDSNDGEDIEVDEIESTVTAPTVTTGHPQLTAEETPLEEDGSVPLINPNSHREERHVSPVDGPDAVQPLELAASITHEDLGSLPEIQLPPGYATGDNMERDVPDTIYPPPYEPTYDYSSYDKIKFRSGSNAFMGIIGTLVFGLIGLAVWVAIVVLTGNISPWGSVAVVPAVFLGYRIAGRAFDKKAIVISIIMSLLFAVAGVFVTNAIDSMNVLSETFFTETTIRDGMNWIMNSLGNAESMKIIVSNGMISLVVTLVADIVAAVVAWKNS